VAKISPKNDKFQCHDGDSRAGTNQWVLPVGICHSGFSSVLNTACLPAPVRTGRDYNTKTVSDNGVRQIVVERICVSRGPIPSASE